MKNSFYTKRDFNSFLNDKEVLEEVLNMKEIQEFAKGATAPAEGLESAFPGHSSEGLEGMFKGPMSPGFPTGLEAIVKVTGRPVLLVQDNTYEKPKVGVLLKRLDDNKDAIESVIPKVARVELLNSVDYNYVGTAWVVDEGVLITNRHVANVFARRLHDEFIFRLSPNLEPYQVQVDFKEEYGRASDAASSFGVLKVLHIEPDSDYAPDMAFMRVESDDLPDPIPFSGKTLRENDNIGVIGYPAYDTRNNIVEMERIFNGIYNVKRFSPGMVSEIDPRSPFFMHDCTSLGGSSGSVVFDLESGKAVGLHFAGRFMDANYAIRSELIQSRLVDLKGRNFSLGTAMPSVEEEAVPLERMEGRSGYDSGFLGTEVPLLKMVPALQKKVAKLIDSDEVELKYEHFSVIMHKERKMAIYTVSNIDGNKMFAFRRGRDRWNYDPRMDKEFQAGQALYSSNDFHRGHLVRRLDPVWGDTRKEARRAMEDTFFWTNCTPQHKRFNPTSWLGLEDYILDNADTRDIRVSLFTGPVFGKNDQKYRKDCRIPEEFWKVAIVDNVAKGRLSATGYLLSQKDLVADIEFVFGQYKTYQVPISVIEKRTGLLFGLEEYDPMATTESLPRTIMGRYDILL